MANSGKAPRSGTGNEYCAVNKRDSIKFLKGPRYEKEVTKMKNTVFTIILIALFVGLVSAQKNFVTGKAQLAPGITLMGVQTAPGSYDDFDKKCWGNTFVLNGSGEWFSIHMTITMDYAEGLPNFKEGNVISLGTWSMVLFRENTYVGTAYGDVVEGLITWQTDPKTGAIEKRNTGATLRMLGSVDGMEKFENFYTPMAFSADTLLTGKTAVTVATLNAEF